MIVCHCNAVRADEIRTEVRLGATTVEEVARRCGAAARCGGCLAGVLDVMADERHRAETSVVVTHCAGPVPHPPGGAGAGRPRGHRAAQ